jgi:hypothetical protein
VVESLSTRAAENQIRGINSSDKLIVVIGGVLNGNFGERTQKAKILPRIMNFFRCILTINRISEESSVENNRLVRNPHGVKDRRP